jgi:hypothetical protein
VEILTEPPFNGIISSPNWKKEVWVPQHIFITLMSSKIGDAAIPPPSNSYFLVTPPLCSMCSYSSLNPI